MRVPPTRVPPTLEIDERDRFAWLRFLAGSVWGGDPRKMNRALAIYSSELLGLLREVSRQPAPPVTLEALSQQMGIPAAELARMPGSAVFYTSFFAEPVATARALDERVFEPIGHFRTVAEAPGSEQLLLEYSRSFRDGAFYAGTMLALTATLERRHPDIPASLNRSIAILEGWKARGLMRLPSDRTLLSAWKTWRHVAPLWAAFSVEFQDARTSGLSNFAAGLETLQDPVRLGHLLGCAKWFRRFAISFMPERAAAPLIPPAEALEIICHASEEEPSLAALPEADLAAARSYQAPTRKFYR